MEQRAAPRAPAIDLGRILAALAVFAYHNLYLMPLTGRVPWEAAPWLTPVASYGYLGVEFFFMVSGYVIAMSAASRDRFTFARDRFARLAPAFVMCIVLTAIVRAAFGNAVSPAALIANFSLHPGYLGLEYVDDVYWSLGVEAIFYASVCIVIIGAPFFRLRMRRTIAIWGLLALLLTNTIFSVPLNLQWAPYFGVGIATYLWQGKRRERDLWLMVGFIGLAAWRAWVQAFSVGASLPVHPNPAAAGLIVLALGIAMPFLADMQLPLRGCRIAAALGAISYPLYLLHNEFARPFLSMVSGNLIGSMMVVALLFAICHGIATAEIPIRRVIRSMNMPWRNRTTTANLPAPSRPK